MTECPWCGLQDKQHTKNTKNHNTRNTLTQRLCLCLWKTSQLYHPVEEEEREGRSPRVQGEGTSLLLWHTAVLGQPCSPAPPALPAQPFLPSPVPSPLHSSARVVTVCTIWHVALNQTAPRWRGASMAGAGGVRAAQKTPQPESIAAINQHTHVWCFDRCMCSCWVNG